MSKYDERVGSITERTVASMYAFWSAMLTAHTVLLSVAVALTTAVSSVAAWQFKLVAVIATLCMVALLFNFGAVRMQYEAIGRLLSNDEADLSAGKRKEDISKANARRVIMRFNEYFASIGLVVEATLLAWVLVI